MTARNVRCSSFPLHRMLRVLQVLLLVLLVAPQPASQAPGAGDGEGIARNESLAASEVMMSTSAAAAVAQLEDDPEEEDATQGLPSSSMTTPQPPVHPPTTLSTSGQTNRPTTITAPLSSTEAATKAQGANVLTWSARDKVQPSNTGAAGPPMMKTDNSNVKKVEQHQSKNASQTASESNTTDNTSKTLDSTVVIPTTEFKKVTSTSIRPTHLTLHALSPSTRRPTHTPSTTTHSTNTHHSGPPVPFSPQEHLPPSFHNDHERHPHHSSKPDHVENVRGPGPYFRPPGAISRQHHHHADNAWEVDPNCWPRCENVTSPEGQKRLRKHSSFKEKKFYNYKLLYDTLKHQGSLKRKETEYYAWIFGATMLTLGTLTTFTSCVVFCVCGDKLKKRKQKRKPKDKCGGQYYQRVDSVSSMVDSHMDPQDYIEQLDSVTII